MFNVHRLGFICDLSKQLMLSWQLVYPVQTRHSCDDAQSPFVFAPYEIIRSVIDVLRSSCEAELR